MIRVTTIGLVRCCVVTVCVLATSEAPAQPEARVYIGVYEKVGVTGGYSVNRTRLELQGAFRIDHVPANNYVTKSHPWPSIFLFQQAVGTYSDNTWQENTTMLTARFIRAGDTDRKWVNFYWGAYLRCLIRRATPDTDGWSNADASFMEDNRMPVSNGFANVFGGLLYGVRGGIGDNFFWDANLGLRLIPWFYQYQKMSYNDGTSDKESFQMAGYQYSAPGDIIVQFGVGYKFVRRNDQ